MVFLLLGTSRVLSQWCLQTGSFRELPWWLPQNMRCRLPSPLTCWWHAPVADLSTPMQQASHLWPHRYLYSTIQKWKKLPRELGSHGERTSTREAHSSWAPNRSKIISCSSEQYGRRSPRCRSECLSMVGLDAQFRRAGDYLNAVKGFGCLDAIDKAIPAQNTAYIGIFWIPYKQQRRVYELLNP